MTFPYPILLAAAMLLAAAPARPSQRQLKAGEVHLYRLELETSAVFRRGLGASDDLDKLKLAVSGTLEVAVARREGDAAVARLRLSGIGLRGQTGGKPLAPEAFAATKKALARGVLARLEADGTAPFVDARSAEDAQGAEILRYLAAALQATLPRDAESSWVAPEKDPTGVYDASYRETGRAGGGFKFEKTKTGYGQSKMALFSAKCDGIYHGVVGADGWPTTLAGEEQAQAFMGEKRPLSAVATKVTLKEAGTRAFTVDEAKALAQAPMPDEDSGSAARKFSPERLKASAAAALGSMGVPEILKRAHELEATTDKGEPELEIFEKVRAFAIVHPERLAELDAALTKETQSSIFYRGGMLALGQLGTPAAQALVRREIQAKVAAGDWEGNVFLMPLLAEPEMPEEANDALLRALRADSVKYDIRVSAHLSLGRMADQLKTVAPARANTIVDEYAAMLPAAKTREDRGLVIDALANSSSARLPGIFKAELASSDTERQAAALYALRLVRSRESAALLAAAATGSKDGGVRRAAAEALVHHYGLLTPYLQKLLPRLKSEPNSEIRQVILRALSDEVRRNAAVRQAVEAAARDDKDKDVRSYAASILKANGKIALFP